MKPSFVTSGDRRSHCGHTSAQHRGFLWGRVPAIDVLRVSENEGNGFNGDLNLLFAGKFTPLYKR